MVRPLSEVEAVRSDLSHNGRCPGGCPYAMDSHNGGALVPGPTSSKLLVQVNPDTTRLAGASGMKRIGCMGGCRGQNSQAFIIRERTPCNNTLA